MRNKNVIIFSNNFSVENTRCILFCNNKDEVGKKKSSRVCSLNESEEALENKASYDNVNHYTTHITHRLTECWLLYTAVCLHTMNSWIYYIWEQASERTNEQTNWANNNGREGEIEWEWEWKNELACILCLILCAVFMYNIRFSWPSLHQSHTRSHLHAACVYICIICRLHTLYVRKFMSRCHYSVNANLFIFMDCSQNRHRRCCCHLSMCMLRQF